MGSTISGIVVSILCSVVHRNERHSNTYRDKHPMVGCSVVVLFYTIQLALQLHRPRPRWPPDRAHAAYNFGFTIIMEFTFNMTELILYMNPSRLIVIK